mmetsp:Transcript_5967/g.21840  ORF Transcript_5967/g.21840 Transcript_5967/m.21840 type:complete len:548 (+) Transcript_5967:236-1879(+)
MQTLRSDCASALRAPARTQPARASARRAPHLAHHSWAPKDVAPVRRDPARRALRRQGYAGRAKHSQTRSRQCLASATETEKVESTELEFCGIELPAFEGGTEQKPFDLLVVGCGPAGLAVAEKAGARGLSVGIIDPAPMKAWPNNYGVWVDEFEQLGLTDCIDRTWSKARVITDNGGEGVPLFRPYARVDRMKLKCKLLGRCVEWGVGFLDSVVEGIEHGEKSSTVTCAGGRKVFSKCVLDATGHSRRLVEFERDFTPGYQAAYGIMAEVESHPFDLDTMVFMDWRDEHLKPDAKKRNEVLPTFLYAMPFTPTKVFLEETSLVARPQVEFDDLKERLEQRLAHLGVKVTGVEEEEYCLIPMGGVLPKLPQRVLGIGGTAGMVHPSTGYMIARTLSSADGFVDALVAGLKEQEKGGKSVQEVCEGVWENIWPDEEQRQRTFMQFGMEVLMELDVHGTRRFFNTFFQLQDKWWGGFLSWRLSAVNLIRLGLAIFAVATNKLRFEFVWKALPWMPSFIENFLGAKNAFSSAPFGAVAPPDSEPSRKNNSD